MMSSVTTQRTVLMISYDLNGSENSVAYELVRWLIERHAISWKRPLKSQWLVETQFTAEWWNENLMALTDVNDRFLVTLADRWIGYLDTDVWDWLRTRISQQRQ